MTSRTESGSHAAVLGVPPRCPWVVTLAVLAACSRPAPPNVLLVTFDTTRYDHFGCTGDPEAHTPTVDALASRGLVFDRAYASVALTLPSHTTIMTGLEPLAHGVHNNGRFRVPDALETLAERLRGAGYDTAAFVSAFVLDAHFNLNQGFDVYGDQTRKRSGALDLTVPSRPGSEVTDAALGWLGARRVERPFLLWVHYYDPHLPRELVPPFDAMPDGYAAEIAYADAQLGRLLAALPSLAGPRETLIVFTADHGEGLGAHGERTHGILAYDSTLHVPLVLAGPRVPRGERSDAFARHLDIVPTILRLVGLPVPRDLPGRDLLSASATDDVLGYFESQGPHLDMGWATIEGVRTRRWKYTASPAPAELYDVLQDPSERRNRAAAEPAVVADLGARLTALRATSARTIAAPEDPQLALDERERLAALGYVEAPSAPLDGPALDPRRLASARDAVDEARSFAGAGRWDDAIEALETLAQSASVEALALRTLAPIYAARGRLDDAVTAYRRYLRLTASEEGSLGLARTLLLGGRPADALEALAGVRERSTATGVLRAHALARLGRVDDGLAAIDAAYDGVGDEPGRRRHRAALVIDVAPTAAGERELRALLASAPEDSTLESWLGYYLALWGGVAARDEAWAHLTTAARARSDDAELLANLGWGAATLGRDAEAREALEAALALDPGRSLERYRLGVVLRRAGETERAAALVRTALAERPGAPWAETARILLRQITPQETP